MIKFENVTKKFGDGTVAIEKLDLVIEKGEFVFLTGPSGAGKTTILRLLTREYLPTEGKIFFSDKDLTQFKKNQLPQLRRRVAAVFQDFKLLFDRTVAENVSIALEIIGKKKQDSDQKVSQVLEMVGLADKVNLFPRQLAGGEMQRVSLARALIMEPEVIFADEPTGNLDPQTSWQIIDLLKKVNKKGITLIIATHNYDIVDCMKERVIALEKGRLESDQKKGKYKK
jgi:cell division transport system ATP-binding protein